MPRALCVTQGGHYISYVKAGGAWYLCDDSFVLRVDEATACSPNAYLLYYRHSGSTNSDIKHEVSRAGGF